MKYITYNTEVYYVTSISDTVSTDLPEGMSCVEVTDAVASQLDTGDYQWFDGTNAMTEEEAMTAYKANLPKVVPHSVSARQFKLQLLAQDDLDVIQALVDSQPRAVQIEWETATEFQRNWPTLVPMIAYLQSQDPKWTDEYVDNTFIESYKI